MGWGALTRRLTERWRIVGAYAAVSLSAQALFRTTVLLTDEPAWRISMLLFWVVVSGSCWWNIWRLVTED